MPPPSTLTVTLIQSTILNAISNILAQIIDQYKKHKPFTLNITALLQFITYAIIIIPINHIWQKWLETTYPGSPSWRRSTAAATTPTLTRTTTTCTSSTSNNNNNKNNNEIRINIALSPITSARTSFDNDRNHQYHPSETKGINFPEKGKKLIPSSNTYFRPKQRGTWYNFTMKFLLDQTVGSVMNIVLFIILINILKGLGWTRTWELVCEDFTPIMIARLKYRPVVSTLMYTVVPFDRRVVFGSACGVIWGVYLSLYAAV